MIFQRTLFLNLIAAACASGSTIIPEIGVEAYRNETALYPSVGEVSGSGYTGSGVLISERWVITAGHVADFKKGGKFSIGETDYLIESYATAPGHAAFSTDYDIGLLYLSGPVAGIAPAVLFGFGTDAPLLGREATWVGHGLGGTGITGAVGGPDFRAFTNIIDGYTPRAGLPQPSFFSDFDNPEGTSNSLQSDDPDNPHFSSPTPTRLEGNVTPGDSGGGVFVTVDGVRYLVGISSYTSGFAPGLNSRYGSLSGAAGVEGFLPWIYETTGIAAVPEPGIAALVALGGLLALKRRRIPRVGRF